MLEQLEHGREQKRLGRIWDGQAGGEGSGQSVRADGGGRQGGGGAAGVYMHVYVCAKNSDSWKLLTPLRNPVPTCPDQMLV